MKVPFSIPIIKYSDLMQYYDCERANEKVIQHFKNYTGKKYVLLTSSCRSALYLSYKYFSDQTSVLTSPLTCTEALYPIIAAGHNIIFADINKNDLSFSENIFDVIAKYEPKVLQLIYLGGMVGKLDIISKHAQSKGILIIEDCAQAYGTKYKNQNIGSYGDVACFSLAKNIYGISGGVLATNQEEIYKKASELQNKFHKMKSSLIYYKIVRSYLHSMRENYLYDFIYDKLMIMKTRGNRNHDELKTIKRYLKRIPDNVFNIVYTQLLRFEHNMSRRREIYHKMECELSKIPYIHIFKENDDVECCYSRLYIYSKKISKKTIEKLNEREIEAKHLKQEYGNMYQIRLDKNEKFQEFKTLKECPNYYEIHDNIISLPIYETISDDQINYIKDELMKNIK